MPQSIWSGHIRFGLVHIPVRLYAATESRDLSLHLYTKGGVERVKNRRVGASSGTAIAYSDTVKGFERDDGEVVLLSEDELESVSAERSKVLDVVQFCAIHEIDPLYFERSYWLGPSPTDGAEHPFELFRRALAEADLVGLGTFVLRSKEHVAAIRANDQGLVLHTMFFADEVRDGTVIGHRAGSITVADRELELANQLLGALRAPWDPTTFRDEYRHRVLELIEAKATGKALASVSPSMSTEVPDIAHALEASVRALRPLGDAGGERQQGTEVTVAVAMSARGAVTKPLHPSKVNVRRSSAAKPEELTTAELRTRASKAKIVGRSQMSRAELIEALRPTAPPKQRARTRSA